jgi:hypothetical protein
MDGFVVSRCLTGALSASLSLCSVRPSVRLSVCLSPCLVRLSVCLSLTLLSLFPSSGRCMALSAQKPEYTTGMESMIADLTRVTVARSSHWMMEEFPDEVNAALGDFLLTKVEVKLAKM